MRLFAVGQLDKLLLLLSCCVLLPAPVGAYRGAGIGAIADVYRPDQRGLAIGIVLVSTLVGPVIGPLLGGFLTQGESSSSTWA